MDKKNFYYNFNIFYHPLKAFQYFSSSIFKRFVFDEEDVEMRKEVYSKHRNKYTFFLPYCYHAVLCPRALSIDSR